MISYYASLSEFSRTLLNLKIVRTRSRKLNIINKFKHKIYGKRSRQIYKINNLKMTDFMGLRTDSQQAINNKINNKKNEKSKIV